MEDDIIKALKTSPDDHLSDGFSRKVLAQIRKRERASAVRFLFIQAFVLTVVLAVVTGSLFYFFGSAFSEIFISAAPWFLSIGVVALIIQVCDVLLIRKKGSIVGY